MNIGDFGEIVRWIAIIMVLSFQWDIMLSTMEQINLDIDDGMQRYDEMSEAVYLLHNHDNRGAAESIEYNSVTPAPGRDTCFDRLPGAQNFVFFKTTEGSDCSLQDPSYPHYYINPDIEGKVLERVHSLRVS